LLFHWQLRVCSGVTLRGPLCPIECFDHGVADNIAAISARLRLALRYTAGRT